MGQLVESVPNYSEGRRIDVVDRFAEAVASTPGVHLLDRTSDASHNRSVLTLAGEAGPVTKALERTIEIAVEAIDMDRHTGEHPRIGAVDVIPFVPLGDTTLADCVKLARAFGARIAKRFMLPVYLYAEAAQQPDRVKLADVRRGQYEGLKREISTRGRAPDFGPSRLHPRAGAVA
ncbi:MAG: glutamate formiminotransferase, partial [Chloroflexi bacterium]|nr:glutamate formiminotransferase [Chloroflexota bacterium]